MTETINVRQPAMLVEPPDHEKLYSANWVDNSVYAVTVATSAVTNIAMEARRFVIADSPDGMYVYAGLYGTKIAVIDTATDAVEKIPSFGAATPDGATLGVTSVQAGNTHLVDAATSAIEQPIELGGRTPVGVSFSPHGARGYITDFGGASIGVNRVQMLLAGIGGAPFPFDLPGRVTVFNPTSGATMTPSRLVPPRPASWSSPPNVGAGEQDLRPEEKSATYLLEPGAAS